MIEFEPKMLSREEWLAEVQRARSMTPGERVSETMRLTDLAFTDFRARVRRENPGADEAEVLRL